MEDAGGGTPRDIGGLWVEGAESSALAPAVVHPFPVGVLALLSLLLFVPLGQWLNVVLVGPFGAGGCTVAPPEEAGGCALGWRGLALELLGHSSCRQDGPLQCRKALCMRLAHVGRRHAGEPGQPGCRGAAAAPLFPIGCLGVSTVRAVCLPGFKVLPAGAGPRPASLCPFQHRYSRVLPPRDS